MHQETLHAATDENAFEGAWFPIARWLHKTIQVANLAGAGTVQIEVSSDSVKPAVGADGFVFATVTAANVLEPVVVNNCYAWMRVEKTVGGAGTGQTRATLTAPDWEGRV